MIPSLPAKPASPTCAAEPVCRTSPPPTDAASVTASRILALSSFMSLAAPAATPIVPLLAQERNPRAAAPWLEQIMPGRAATSNRSEEHTSELQSLMRISYAVFCLKKKKVDIHILTPN